MKTRRVCSLISAMLFIALMVAGCAGVTPAPEATSLSMVTVSDIHSNILPYETKVEKDGEKVEVVVGGMDRIAALAETQEGLADGSLLVSGGDNLMGFFYKTFDGVPEIESMNMAGYDITCLGNHEFDLGTEACGKAMKNAEFDIVSSNLTVTEPGLASLVKPYVIKETAGVTIGFFGLMTPDLHRVSSAGSDVVVDNDLISVATEMVNALRIEGVDIIIALTHIGKEFDELVANNVAGIDIIVGGHSHDTFCETVKGPRGWETIVLQAGVNAKEVGVLTFDVAGGKIIASEWKTVLMDESVGSDEEIAAYLAEYDKKLKKQMERPVGETLVDLDALSANVRSRESNLGNLVTDAWVDWFTRPDTENLIALINGGTLRGDRYYKAGPVTYGDLMEIHPYSNSIFEVSLSGKDLLQVLEMSASAINVEGDGAAEDERVPDGGFLQVSGLKIEIDLSGRPYSGIYDGRELVKIIYPGDRITSALVKEGGEWVPINPDKMYTVLVTSWTAAGGDGYAPFIAAEKIDTTVDIVDALCTYIEKRGPVSPEIEGRIVVTEP
ncbi:MAG: bifunctional metallophosphatase/5'-nucleotidase [Deltaproteobacteria bacterium]|nr:bifunctional metallophosphatase/5'-nucleotidase [Candidatus Zymogenaceae bacterium]